MPGFVSELLDNIPNDEAELTKALTRVAEAAQELWNTNPASSELDLLAQRVGDLARAESNRTPLGESGLLEFFCAVVSTQGLRPILATQCLRIIGNSSADKDENRERVVASGCLPSIVWFLNDDSILAFVVPVLFNICVDYEPAQKAIYQAGINPELVNIISSPRLDDAAALLDYICKLLGFVATQEPEANLVHPATPFVLLKLANSQTPPDDAKEFLRLASVALTYLAHEQFQKAFLETPDAIDLIFRAFSTVCGGLEFADDEEADIEQLKPVQTAFTATLADLSAHPLFASSCSLDGPEVQTLKRWISSPHIPLQSAACLALGNIARSDEKCSFLVQQRAIHEPLIAILADPANVDAGLLHAVLGFLKNLAIAADNKPILGAAGLFEAKVLPRIWDLDTQTQVQFDAVSLTRLLLVGCLENVHRICTPILTEKEEGTSSSSVEEQQQEKQPNRSKLQLLIDLNARSDQEPTQMETSRAITTVCRVLHSNIGSKGSKVPTDSSSAAIPVENSNNSNDKTEGDGTNLPSLGEFYSKHTTITDAMLRLGLQSKFPVLRSELLFVFALMARVPEGATVVARAMRRSEFVDVIVEVVTGEKKTTPDVVEDVTDIEEEKETKSSSVEDDILSEIGHITNSLEAQAPTTTKTTATQNKTATDVDRENALVLVAELLRCCPDELSAASRQAFQDLLRTGGERLLRERNQTQT